MHLIMFITSVIQGLLEGKTLRNFTGIAHLRDQVLQLLKANSKHSQPLLAELSADKRKVADIGYPATCLSYGVLSRCESLQGPEHEKSDTSQDG